MPPCLAPAYPALLALVAVIGGLCGAANASWVWTPETGWYNPARDTPTDPAELLTEADEAFQAKRYADAARGYLMLLRSHANSPEAIQAQSKLVEAQFLGRELEDALQSIEMVLGLNPDKATLERVLQLKYEIGYAYITGTQRSFLWMDWSATDHGVKILDSILERFPYQPFCDDALFHIGSYYFREGKYENAETTYKRLLNDYPESDWAGLAEYQIGESAYQRLKGVEYDFAPIDEAESRLRRYVRRFPGGERVKEAGERLAELRRLRAERLYKIAELYLRERRPKAARYYLQRIVRDFPDEPIAPNASSLLAELNRAAQQEKESNANENSSSAGGGDEK